MIFVKIDGFIIYKKIIKNGDKEYTYDFVARCNCKNGEKFNYDGTKVNDSRLRSKYYISSISQLNLNKREEII